MKRTLLLLPILAILTACESSRHGVKCIGLNGTPKPGIEYEYSANNIIVGIVFVEMIAPPVIVVLDELRCPVSTTPPTKK